MTCYYICDFNNTPYDAEEEQLHQEIDANPFEDVDARTRLCLSNQKMRKGADDKDSITNASSKTKIELFFVCVYQVKMTQLLCYL